MISNLLLGALNRLLIYFSRRID